MPAIVKGRINWGLTQDVDGHRDYFITWLMRTTNPHDGPATVLLSPDLPQIGDFWAFGTETDPWAFCQPNWTVEPIHNKEPGIYWTCTQPFTTRPMFRCQDFQFEDPLLEPADISGSFVSESKEALTDRDGSKLVMSSFERMKGAEVEFDRSKPTVRISQNIPVLNLPAFTFANTRVNDRVLWGMNPRCIKLANISWQRLFYQVCSVYYKVTYDFDVDAETFDKIILDHGVMCLEGHSPGSALRETPRPVADADKPEAMEYYLNINGDNVETFLDGLARPCKPEDAHQWVIEKYDEMNFLLLPGIPAILR